MNVLDLFSGIGGFSLGLERAGMRTVAFCEIDHFCRKVIARNFPGRPIFDDVRTLTGKIVADAICGQVREQPRGRDGASRTGSSQPGQPRVQRIDLICGGFPCQDISVAGKGAGIEGERSGLWSEYARIIREVRPRYAIIENVSALLGRGLQRVLWDLAQIGYDAEWHAIPASAVGAPHRRDRVWIVAYDDSARPSYGCEGVAACGIAGEGIGMGAVPSGSGSHVADTTGTRLQQRNGLLPWRQAADAAATSCDGWLSEPDVGRVAHGVPARVDRLRALGNAIVPQIAEIIGRAIMEREAAMRDPSERKASAERTAPASPNSQAGTVASTPGR